MEVVLDQNNNISGYNVEENQVKESLGKLLARKRNIAIMMRKTKNKKTKERLRESNILIEKKIEQIKSDFDHPKIISFMTRRAKQVRRPIRDTFIITGGVGEDEYMENWGKKNDVQVETYVYSSIALLSTPILHTVDIDVPVKCLKRRN